MEVKLKQEEQLALRDIIQVLFDSRFNFDDPVPERPDYLLEIEGEDGKTWGIALQGSIVEFSGLPKSMKSSLMGAFVAASLSKTGRALNIISRITEGAIIWFDTEQSDREFRKSMKRIGLLAGLTKNNRRLIALNLRKFPSEQYEVVKQFTKYMAARTKIGLIVIDGVADIYTSYRNSSSEVEQSDALVKELMSYADIYDCPILTSIHTNKDGKASTGHLGHYLDKRCSYHIRVEKHPSHSTVKVYDSRDGENFKAFDIFFQDGLLQHRVGDIYGIDDLDDVPF